MPIGSTIGTKFGSTLRSPRVRTEGGLQCRPNERVIQAAQAEASRERVRSPLIDLFPPIRQYSAYFNRLSVPAGLSIPAGYAASYGLRSIRVPEDSGSDLLVIGVGLDLLPTDSNGAGINGQVSTGTGAGNALPWGDSTGSSAFMVVGVNTPAQVGAWTGGARWLLPGVQLLDGGSVDNDTTISPTTGTGEYIIREAFPTGKWTDTTPNRTTRFVNTAPGAVLVRAGERIDIALVVSRATVNNLANFRVMCGRAMVTVYAMQATALERVSGV